MNLLMVGAGKGSYTMRGHQLGAALGARVLSEPTADDFRWADLCVLIKKPAIRLAPIVHRSHVPIIWDALDFWSQPLDNPCTEAAARQKLTNTLAVVRPALTIGATKHMAFACRGSYLPHHSWAYLTPAPPQPSVRVVAYEGNVSYLGKWREALEQACKARGWTFLLNPPDLRQADLLVAFRDGPWDGWMPRHWKSGVKLVNAIAAGRPMLTQASSAMEEISAPGTIVERVDALGPALDSWRDHARRQLAYEHCLTLAPQFTLTAIADRYRQILTEWEVTRVAV